MLTFLLPSFVSHNCRDIFPSKTHDQLATRFFFSSCCSSAAASAAATIVDVAQLFRQNQIDGTFAASLYTRAVQADYISQGIN